MRAFVLGLSILGALLFGAAFAVSFASPLTVERLMREVLRVEVEQRTRASIVAWFGLAVSFFGDILLNKARITGRIVSSIGASPSVC